MKMCKPEICELHGRPVEYHDVNLGDLCEECLANCLAVDDQLMREATS